MFKIFFLTILACFLIASIGTSLADDVFVSRQMNLQDNEEKLNKPWGEDDSNDLDQLNQTQNTNQTKASEQMAGEFRNVKRIIQNSQVKNNSNQQPKIEDDKIRFHIIAHSHMDYGWLMTSSEYFNNYVKVILDGVLKSLVQNPKLRFSHAEIKYFQMWWAKLDQKNQTQFKKLVVNGQFEFLQGGLISPDEACPLYQDLLLNAKVGQEFLYKEFGVIPKHAWHADSFGHSSTLNRLYQQLGYQSLFIGRISDDIKIELKQKQDLAFMWRPTFESENGDFENEQSLFTYVMHSKYQAVCGIEIQEFWQMATVPKQMKRKIKEIESTTQRYLNCLRDVASSYKTKNVLLTIGDDFAYVFANETFKFIDMFIQIINTKSEGKFDMFYSTVDQYMQDVASEIETYNIQLKEYKQDFFPLLMQYKLHYWSGYFTSRPNFKEISRDLSYNAYQSLTFYSQYLIKDLESKISFQDISNLLQDRVSVIQHHDTITGTSRQNVVNKNQVMIDQLLYDNGLVQSGFLRIEMKLLGLHLNQLKLSQHKVNELLSPIINIPFKMSLLLIIYNPSLGYYQNPYVKIDIDTIQIEAWDYEKNDFIPIDYQQNCEAFPDKIFQECDTFLDHTIKPLQSGVFKINYKDGSEESERHLDQNSILQIKDKSRIKIGKETFVDLKFQHPSEPQDQSQKGPFRDNVPDIPNEIRKRDSIQDDNGSILKNIEQVDGLQINNFHCSLTIVNTTETTIVFKYRESNHIQSEQEYERLFSFDFRYYTTYSRGSLQKGGIYTFKTIDRDPRKFKHSILSIKTRDGIIPTMVIIYKDQQYRHQIVRIILPQYDQKKQQCQPIEFNVDFSGIDINTEVTINFEDLETQNNGTFYTDSNGLGLIKRKFKNESDIDKIKALAPQNFYPINSAIFLEDQNNQNQMIVMNDRTQSGSAFRKGHIELMFNRRSSSSDDLGLPDMINEYDYKNFPIQTNNRYYLAFTQTRKAAFDMIFEHTIKRVQSPLVYFYSEDFRHEFSPKQDQQLLLLKKKETQRKIYTDFLKSMNVIDIKLIPDSNFKTILINLVIYPNDVTKQIDQSKLIEYLCEYSRFDIPRGCLDLKQFQIKRVKLTGLEFESQEEMNEFDDYVYRMETYKITL
ncbi:lysosomal alpha-mannosidase [Stylonychia lemnae]|uniref:Lysosomal alpha-mannosidase n=1 Tax=Stylonychia lemnae TaxID=5949 RepID=A0A078A5H2_STYLE|nr:lysosomal alpha-mannosidase [Stylonychia lemnae]|eukprot:CDW76004.1 lysosomal alpha-mannosidase [Stylonychia lemnae]